MHIYFLLTGEVLGSLCYLKGSDIYGMCSKYVLKLIKDNMERDTMDTGSVFGDESESSDLERSTSPTPKQRVRVCISTLLFPFIKCTIYFQLKKCVGFRD